MFGSLGGIIGVVDNNFSPPDSPGVGMMLVQITIL